MKKTILLLLAMTVLSSCSSQKKTNSSTFMKGFFAYYNTLFNSKDALETELKNRDKAHKDNFYDPYIQLLTYDEQPLGSELGAVEILSDKGNPPGNMSSNGPGSPGLNRSSASTPQNSSNSGVKTGATILEISEAKALKAIAKYSVMKGGVEKNKKIFDANILFCLLYTSRCV